MFNKSRLNRGMYWDEGLTLVQSCTRVSEGCQQCWMLAMEKRFKRGPGEGNVEFHPERLDRLKRKTPTAFSIWGDLFHPYISFDQLSSCFDQFQEYPHHRIMILTKRPDRAALFADKYRWNYKHNELSHVWVGTTVELEKYIWRIDLLRKIPARVRFLSLEPLLGPLDLRNYLEIDIEQGNPGKWVKSGFRPEAEWVICGAETGPGKRHMDPDWARLIRDQAQAAGVPFFFKKDSKGSYELDGQRWVQVPKT